MGSERLLVIGLGSKKEEVDEMPLVTRHPANPVIVFSKDTQRADVGPCRLRRGASPM